MFPLRRSLALIVVCTLWLTLLVPGGPIIASPAPSFPSPTTPATHHVLVQIGRLNQSVFAAVAQGNYLYALSESGLRIIDISQPTTPVLKSTLSLTMPGDELVAQGNYVYIAELRGGLIVVNVANPTAPAQVGFLDTAGLGNAVGLAVAGNIAYLAGSGDLYLINVADPANPRLAGVATSPQAALDVVVQGNYAYVADWNTGLRILDVSNPAVPVQVGSVEAPVGSRRVALAGTYAYLLDYGGGLRVINVANPSTPKETAFRKGAGYGYEVLVAGEYAYLAAGDGGVRAVQVADPAAPIEVASSTPTGATAYGLAVAGDKLFVGLGQEGVVVLQHRQTASEQHLYLPFTAR